MSPTLKKQNETETLLTPFLSGRFPNSLLFTRNLSKTKLASSGCLQFLPSIPSLTHSSHLSVATALAISSSVTSMFLNLMTSSQALSYLTYPAFDIVNNSCLLEILFSLGPQDTPGFCSTSLSSWRTVMLAVQNSTASSTQNEEVLKPFPPNPRTI